MIRTKDSSQDGFDAWAELRAGVLRYVAHRVADAHAAEDITQDVMLKVRAKLATTAGVERLEAWVIAIARNAVVDHYRARRPAAPLDAAAGVALTDGADRAAEGDRAITELSSCVRPMIDRLDPADAQALRLADMEGLSQQALADRIGLSLSGAKSRVQRARAKLSAMILDCCDIERNRHGGVVDFERTPRSGGYCGPEAPGDRCA
jgi:RNA polymerase sigma-70 factor, ECF subfamily